MPRAVGLDLGSRLLKLVELSGSAKSFKVHRVVVSPVPEGTGEEAEKARVDLLHRLFRENHLPEDDVCASFDAGTTVFRDVTVPFREDDQIEKVVRFEAENHLHGRAIEDVIVNWVKTGETKEGSQILVLAAPKSDLAARLGILRRAGVEPASMDLDVTALYTACDAAGVFREHPSCVVLDVGARTTSLVVVDGGRLRAARAFLVGSESISTQLQQDLSLPAGEASARALRGGGPDPDALLVPAAAVQPAPSETAKSVAELEQDVAAQRREEFVRKLHREAMRSLASARTETPPERILLAGGGSLVPGLAEALAERVGIPVEPLALLTRLGWRSRAEDPRLEEAVTPVAVGCALRVLGYDPLGVELRQDDFAPSNTFEVVRGVLATAVTLLVALLAGLAFVTKENRDRERGLFLTGANSVCSKAATIFEQIEKRYQQDVKGKSDGDAGRIAVAARKGLPNDASYLLFVRSHLQRRYRELEENLGLSKDIPGIESALKIWQEIYLALGKVDRNDLGWFRINKMSISQQSASMTIEIDNESTLDKVVRALNTSAYLKQRAKDPSKPVNVGNLQANAATKRFTAGLEIPFLDETR